MIFLGPLLNAFAWCPMKIWNGFQRGLNWKMDKKWKRVWPWLDNLWVFKVVDGIPWNFGLCRKHKLVNFTQIGDYLINIHFFAASTWLRQQSASRLTTKSVVKRDNSRCNLDSLPGLLKSLICSVLWQPSNRLTLEEKGERENNG